MIRHGAAQDILSLKQGGSFIRLSQQHLVALLDGAEQLLAAAALFMPVVEKQGVLAFKHIQSVGGTVIDILPRLQAGEDVNCRDRPAIPCLPFLRLPPRRPDAAAVCPE